MFKLIQSLDNEVHALSEKIMESKTAAHDTMIVLKYYLKRKLHQQKQHF